jgi:hypothetical protein
MESLQSEAVGRVATRAVPTGICRSPTVMPPRLDGWEGPDLQSGRSRVCNDRGFSRWGPWVQLESRKRGAITVLGWIRHEFRHDGILVDVYNMSGEILCVADAMVGKIISARFLDG